MSRLEPLNADSFVSLLGSEHYAAVIDGVLHAEPQIRPTRSSYLHGEVEKEQEARKATSILKAITGLKYRFSKDIGVSAIGARCLLKAFHQDSEAYFSHPLPLETWVSVLAMLEAGVEHAVLELEKPTNQYLQEFERELLTWLEGRSWRWANNATVREDLGTCDGHFVATKQYRLLIDNHRVGAIAALKHRLVGYSALTPELLSECLKSEAEKGDVRNAAETYCILSSMQAG